MHNRGTLCLVIVLALQGCSSNPSGDNQISHLEESELDVDGHGEIHDDFKEETPVNEAANGINFRTNEPARRIATDILNGMDFEMKHSPIPNRQRLIAMKEENLSFCAGNLSDKTITAYIETTLIGSQLGDLQTFGAKTYCVNDMGAIKLLSYKDVSLPPNDRRRITWVDVDPTRKVLTSKQIEQERKRLFDRDEKNVGNAMSTAEYEKKNSIMRQMREEQQREEQEKDDVRQRSVAQLDVNRPGTTGGHLV